MYKNALQLQLQQMINNQHPKSLMIKLPEEVDWEKLKPLDLSFLLVSEINEAFSNKAMLIFLLTTPHVYTVGLFLLHRSHIALINTGFLKINTRHDRLIKHGLAAK